MSPRLSRILAITGTVTALLLTAVLVFVQDRAEIRNLRGQTSSCVMSNPPGASCPAGWTPAGNGCYAPPSTSCPLATCPGGFGQCMAGSCTCTTAASSSFSSSCTTCACCVSNPGLPQCAFCSSASSGGNSANSFSSFIGNNNSSTNSNNPPSSGGSSNPPSSAASSVATSNPSSSAASSNGPSSASSQASFVQSSASNNPPSSGTNSSVSSSFSCSSLGNVVCPDVPPSCDYPSGEIPGCTDRCLAEHNTCFRNALNGASSIRMPNMTCPPPGPLEICGREKQECLCGCQVNYDGRYCSSSSRSTNNSSRSSSSASSVACPEGAFCGTTQECAQAYATYVMPPNFCGTADAGTHCCRPPDDKCPDGYTCMDKDLCLEQKGKNNGVGMCGGDDSTTCCKLSSSSSSTGEEWVFTACPGDTKADPVLCVFRTPSSQATCPTGTGITGGTCKNTKYENGVIVAQSVGICCTALNSSSRSSSSTSTAGVACCMPSLNYSCLQVATLALCTNAQGIAMANMQQCNLNCRPDSSPSSSSRSSSSSSRSPSSSSSSSRPSSEGCAQFGTCPSSSSRSPSSSSRSSSSSRNTSEGCGQFGNCSSSSSSVVVGGICYGTECDTTGNFYCADQGKICTQLLGFPCMRCDGITPPSSSSSSSFTPPYIDSSSSSGNGCTENYQCPSGLCIDGTCTHCTQNNQCDSNQCINGVCQPLPPGAPCTDNLQCSTKLCKDGICQNPLPPGVLAFLDEPCTSDFQCITNLCINNLCTACTANNQCASGMCRNGICLTGTLPNGAQCSTGLECLSGFCLDNVCTDRSVLPNGVVIDPLTGKPLLASPDTLPAMVIELPFTDASGQQCHRHSDCEAGQSCVNGRCVQTATKDVPAVPSTGPAALAVMLAGGAAGWLYRKRRK